MKKIKKFKENSDNQDEEKELKSKFSKRKSKFFRTPKKVNQNKHFIDQYFESEEE